MANVINLVARRSVARLTLERARRLIDAGCPTYLEAHGSACCELCHYCHEHVLFEHDKGCEWEQLRTQLESADEEAKK